MIHHDTTKQPKPTKNKTNNLKNNTTMFENYEIWWVTGAQLLYGGDAVVKVDAHSREW